MTIYKRPQSNRIIFIQEEKDSKEGKKGRDLWQDKYADYRIREASHQPVMDNKSARKRLLNINPARSQNRDKGGERKVQVAAWVDEPVREELQRLARKEGLSVSATIAALLGEALLRNLHQQHAALLPEIIEKAIDKRMAGRDSRFAALLVRMGYDIGQTRSLVTNLLGRQTGVTPDILKTILSNSGKTAKRNLAGRTPQITELIKAVEEWMDDERQAPEDKPNAKWQ